MNRSCLYCNQPATQALEARNGLQAIAIPLCASHYAPVATLADQQEHAALFCHVMEKTIKV